MDQRDQVWEGVTDFSRRSLFYEIVKSEIVLLWTGKDWKLITTTDWWKGVWLYWINKSHSLKNSLISASKLSFIPKWKNIFHLQKKNHPLIAYLSCDFIPCSFSLEELQCPLPWNFSSLWFSALWQLVSNYRLLPILNHKHPVTSDNCSNTRSLIGNSSCSESTLTDCTVFDSDVRESTCTSSQYDNVKMSETTTTRSHLSDTTIDYSTITRSRITSDRGSNCIISGCSMTRGRLSGSCRISGCRYGPAWMLSNEGAWGFQKPINSIA